MNTHANVFTAPPFEQTSGRHGRPRATAGQTLVECAMVLQVFMLLTAGLLDGLRVVLF